MKLVASNAIPISSRNLLDPELYVIDYASLLEVLRRQMVHGIEAVWREGVEGELRISFPATVEPEMIIPAGRWERDADFNPQERPVRRPRAVR